MPRPDTSRQKVSGSLRSFADTKKISVELLKDIQAHVVAEGAKHNLEREPHLIHVSELVKDTCPRLLYYKVAETPVSDTVPAAAARLEMIWAAGNQEHAKWQNWLAEMGDLYGNWKCVSCDHPQGPSERPETCPECGCTRFVYDELHLEDPDYPLVGHADGAVPRLRSLAEVKTFSVGSVRYENPDLVKEHTHTVSGKQITDHESIWKAIKRPFKSHLKQGSFYLWMCKRLGLPFDRIVFIYENKVTQATKAFEIGLSERLIKDEIALLEQTFDAVENEEVPARPKVYSKDAKPCNSCPFRTHCWGTEETDDNDPEESTSVPSRRSSQRGEEAGGAAEVRSSRASRGRGTEGSRRHHRSRRPGTDGPDDPTDSVGRAHRRATGPGRGGRAVGRGSDGGAPRSRFSRTRQGRDDS